MKKSLFTIVALSSTIIISTSANALNTPFATQQPQTIQINTGTNASQPRSNAYLSQLKQIQGAQEQMKNDIRDMLNDPKLDKPFINKNDFANFQALASGAQNFPQMKFFTDKGNYYAQFIMPGYKKENIDLNVDNGDLKVTAKAEQSSMSNLKNYQSFTENLKNFSKSIKLPNDVDVAGIRSDYKNGVLTVTLPKLKNSINTVSRQISVN